MLIIPEEKRYILPFSVLSENRREPFSSETIEAAVYVLAEFERVKSGFNKQSEELLFVAKFGYPIWLVTKNETTLIFDGLDNSSYNLPCNEIPNVKTFMDNMERYTKTYEGYMAFLTDHSSYFKQPLKKKKMPLNGLIVNTNFRNEMNLYLKQSMELAVKNENIALLAPTLDEPTIYSLIDKIENIQSYTKQEIEQLPQCIKLVNSLTSQRITELKFQADAFTDETDAKIKALQELINPQITKIKKDFSNTITILTDNLEIEISTLKKQKLRTKSQIESTRTKIRQYKANSKAHATKNHSHYAKIWKQKKSKTDKELTGLKNQLKRTEKHLENLSLKKMKAIDKLELEREATIEEARQPLRNLESVRDSKIVSYNEMIENIENKVKPLIYRMTQLMKLQETSTFGFEVLGIKRFQQMKNLVLTYIPFYIACYRSKLSERYFILPPSKIGALNLSAKIKGALGMPKIKEMFTPRFQAITSLIILIQELPKQSSMMEAQINEMGKRHNILTVRSSCENAKKELLFLKHEGWISEKEQQVLSKKLF
jgi:uncharacterized protein YukE